MQKYLNPSTLYLFCWIIFAFLPYVFFSSKIILLLLIYFSVSSIYYSFILVSEYEVPIYFKLLFPFVFVLSIYGVGLIFVGEDVYWQACAQYVDKYNYLLWLLTSMMSSVPIYVFTCRGYIDEKVMRVLFFILLYSCIYAYEGSLQFQIQKASLLGSEQTEFTVTCVYSFLSILPLVALFKKSIVLQFILISVIFVYCVLGVKRGPIIFGGIASLIIIFYMLKQNKLWKKILVLVVALVCLVGLYEFIMFQMESSPYFAVRFQDTLDGNTSGRDEYAKNIFDYYLNYSSNKDFLWGVGALGTLSVNESYAHNDWIGILLEQGLLGGLLYFLYWIGFVYSWIKSKPKEDCFLALGLLVLIGFGKTMISMYYLPITAEMITSSGFFAIVLGYYLARAFPQDKLRNFSILQEGFYGEER